MEELGRARTDQAQIARKSGQQTDTGTAYRTYSRGGNSEPFSAARGHYDGNVDPQVNLEANIRLGLGNHPYHLGDLPNQSVDESSKGSLSFITSRVTLSDGLNTLFGKDSNAFNIHELRDSYLPNPPTKDEPGGTRTLAA